VDDIWVDGLRRRLLDYTRCPSCGTALTGTTCTTCGVVLDGAAGRAVADASRSAADVLAERQRLVDALRATVAPGWRPAPAAGPVGAVPPRAWVPEGAGQPAAGPGGAGGPVGGSAAGAPAPSGPASDAPPVGPSPLAPPVGAPWAGGPVGAPGPGGSPLGVPPVRPGVPPQGPGVPPMRPVLGPPTATPPWASPARPANAPRRELDVAALLALAGAGLVAAAAMVFAFFVVADAPVARVAVLLVATGAGVVGTVVLRRRGIGSSAEAVAGLSAALVVVDAWVVALLAHGPARWWLAALALLAAGLGTATAGRATGLRSWTAAVLVLPLVPLCVAAAFGTPLAWMLGLLAGSLVTLVRGPHRRAVTERLGVDPTVERGLLMVAGALLIAAALPAGVTSTVVDGGVVGWPGGRVALTLLLMAATALAHGRLDRAVAWYAWTGLLAVGAAAATMLFLSTSIALGLVVLAAAVAWGLLVLAARATLPDVPADGVRPPTTVTDPRAHAMLAGGWAAMLLVAVPGLLWAASTVLGLLAPIAPAPGRGPWGTLVPGAFAQSTGDPTGLAGAVIAVAVVAAALLAAARLPLTVRRTLTTLPGLAGPAAGTVAVPTWVQTSAIVRLGRTVGPAAAVLLAATAVATLRTWAIPLLVAEALLAAALVETARRLHPLLAPAHPTPTSPLPTPTSPLPTSPLPTPTPSTLVPAETGGPAGQVPHEPPGSAPAAAPVWSAPAAASSRRTWAVTTLVAAAVQIALLATLTWVAAPVLAVGTVVVVALLLRARTLAVPDLRPAVVGLAAAYPAIVLLTLLLDAGWSGIAALGLVSVLLTLLTAVVTVLRRVDPGSWVALLGVAAVPAALGIGATALDRTLWSAAVAVALLVLEGVVLAVRARPVPDALRVWAAALVVPTLSVVVIDAGAVWVPGSAAPVLLPVVAVLVAAVAVAAPTVAGRLRARTGTLPAEPCRRALEWTAAATAGIGLLLAVARPSTGAATVLVLCAILGAGATAVAQRPDRRPVWWAAALLWLGVVWSALAWSGVGLVEAYTVPPAVVALGVAAVATWRGRPRTGLAVAGTALLVVPSLVLAGTGRATGTRAITLLAVGAVLLAVAVLADRPRTRERLGALADPLALGALVAGLGGTVRAVHLAATTPLGTEHDNATLFLAALAWSALGAALLAGAGRLLADRRAATVRRWAFVPALVAGSIGGLVAVRPTWTVVWVAWAVEIALLALAVLSVRLAAGAPVRPSSAAPAGTGTAQPGTAPAPTAPATGIGATFPVLPDGWLLWLAALAWAIGGWSLRELRVEVFALPLGLGLFALGLVALRSVDRDALAPSGPRVWPVGWPGSVVTLTPGVLATLGPSMLAIWTDPLTWRAIVVVALALGFMLLGARQMLRAPLVVGAGALPVAVVSVFAGQLGRAVSAGPWLLTLLAAGGLLLVLGIYSERRRTVLAEAGEAAPERVLR
jgi:hypothetical protein